MKKITNKVLWIFAIGQFGWSLLSGIISSWLTYYYFTNTKSPLYGTVTTSALFLGITLFGVITAVGRIFDAVTDPLIAGWSDRSNFKGGRRIPFMKVIAIPFAVMTACVFILPQTDNEIVNDVLLFATLILFYLFMTIYCTPYNALIAELGDTQKNRVNVSTYISFTYILGFSVSYLIPNFASVLNGGPFLGDGTVTADSLRITIGIMCAIAAIAMLIPSFLIKEREYISSVPVKTHAFKSLLKTFKNKQFLRFVFSDIIYFFAVTLFQTGLASYETELMGLDETWTFPLTAIMTVVSLCLYPVINRLAPKLGKKRIIAAGFFTYSCVFVLAAACGTGLAWGIIIAVCAGVPMAILGILPQAVVADIAEVDAIETGEKRSGMFFAARTFAMKMGQAISMLVFTSVVAAYTTGTGDAAVVDTFGYRLTAIIAAVCCVIGAILFLFYNERKIMKQIAENTNETENEIADEADKN